MHPSSSFMEWDEYHVHELMHVQSTYKKVYILKMFCCNLCIPNFSVLENNVVRRAFPSTSMFDFCSSIKLVY